MTDKHSTNPKKSFRSIFKSLFITGLFIFFGIVGLLSGIAVAYIKTADFITPEELILKGFTTGLYDKDGKYLSPLYTDKNRELVDFKYIPQNLRNAIIAIEDKRFYEHRGVDIKRTASAVFSFLSQSSSKHGGSTITQQVIKNITGETERSLRRKIQEQWKAIELEKHLTKDQILETYMNIIYMGNGCYGVQSASKMYFGKSVDTLNLAQCATLAGITNAPSIYDPFTTKGRENLNRRKDIILKEMLASGFISSQEYKTALQFNLQISKNKQITPAGHIQPYYADKVVLDVKKGLMEKGYSEEIAIKMIYNNGLKIYTTIDPVVQSSLDEAFSNASYFAKVNYQTTQLPQAAMVVLDTKNGQVRGLYGGAGKKVGGGLNRASDSQVQRQPGSTFKPIAVYGPALNEKLITASTVIDDVPVHMNGNSKPAYPKNYDNTYGGLTSIREALKKSVNVVAAQIWIMRRDFPEIAHQYLQKVNLNRSDEQYVSVSLGGLERGVNTMQMAAAYVPFANRGLFYEPITYTKVVDTKGKIILENKPEITIVYEEETAAIMTNMMQGVVQPGGTAYPLGQISNGRVPSAGKTGTTSDNKDKWFVGYSPYLVGAVWYGYDKPIGLVPTEYNRAQQIWHQVMNKIHSRLPQKNFATSSSIVKKPVCIYSGKAVTSLCSQDPRGNAVREEWFVSGTEPKENETCDVHVTKNVCADHKDALGKNYLATSACPNVVSKVMLVRPKPYYPVAKEDPFPLDSKYIVSPSYFCPFHGGSKQIPSATPSGNSIVTPEPNNSTTPLSNIEPTPPLEESPLPSMTPEQN